MDPLKELEEIANKGDRVNFIPCVAWVQRGVAKTNPDQVYPVSYLLGLACFIFLV